MQKPFEELSSGEGREKETLSNIADKKLIFSVFQNQFKRGLINIRPCGLVSIEDVQNGGMMLVAENNPEDVICTYQEDSRGHVLAVFKSFEDAAWFDDGLSY